MEALAWFIKGAEFCRMQRLMICTSWALRSKGFGTAVLGIVRLCCNSNLKLLPVKWLMLPVLDMWNLG